MSEELRSCPFCGSGPARGFGQGPGQASFSGVEMMRGEKGRHYVQCGTCGAQSLTSFHEGAAISNWNTRADFPGITDPAAFVQAARGCVEALEAILHAVCHDTGFAAAVRADSGVAYPWEALDISEEQSRAALTAFCAATGDKM